jgi:hypothetical protein
MQDYWNNPKAALKKSGLDKEQQDVLLDKNLSHALKAVLAEVGAKPGDVMAPQFK